MENLKREIFGVDSNMEMAAIGIVADYIKEHLDKYDGMYYEVTYNGDKDEWYLDAYKKFENRCIKL